MLLLSPRGRSWLRYVLRSCDSWILHMPFALLLSPPSLQPSLTLCAATRPLRAHFPHPVLFTHLPCSSSSALRSLHGVSKHFVPAETKTKRDGGIGGCGTYHTKEKKTGLQTRSDYSRSRLISCFQGTGASAYVSFPSVSGAFCVSLGSSSKTVTQSNFGKKRTEMSLFSDHLLVLLYICLVR